MTNYQILMCTCPDQKTAESLARQLLEAKLAACINILPGITSMYHWQGQIESAAEHLMLIKSLASNYSKLEQLLLQQHPYDIPEIIALPIVNGLPGYLDWIGASVSGK